MWCLKKGLIIGTDNGIVLFSKKYSVKKGWDAGIRIGYMYIFHIFFKILSAMALLIITNVQQEHIQQ